MLRCRYEDDGGDLKIDKATFEPEKRREDYLNVCFEVSALLCLLPLPSQYKTALGAIKSVLIEINDSDDHIHMELRRRKVQNPVKRREQFSLIPLSF